MTLKEKHKELRKTVRKFLFEIQSVPFRAVDCDQAYVDQLEDQLKKLVNYRDS